MSIKLYVDKVSYPMSKTENLSAIQYNCKIIGGQLTDAVVNQIINSGGTTFFSAGKYFGILSIMPEKKSFNMLFIEFENNEEVFYKFLQEGLKNDSSALRQNAIRVFNQLSLDYDKNFNLVELIEGEPPKTE